MSWRVVVVSRRCKLEYKLGYLVCRGEEVKKVFLSEVDTLIVESTAVSLTAALLCELVKNKVNVVFCDEKHNPHSQLLALAGRYDSSGCLRKQIKWTQQSKQEVWAQVVRYKIWQQYLFAKEIGCEKAEMLARYASEVKTADSTNREGHAAKVYFNLLFGLSFKRGDDSFWNGALNYGYAVILSAFNRAIVANGYVAQLGIAHRGHENQFNLACDLMEPFRVLVDRMVFSSGQELTPAYKHYLCDVLNTRVRMGKEMCTVEDAINRYCRSVFYALETEDPGKIVCYEL